VEEIFELGGLFRLVLVVHDVLVLFDAVCCDVVVLFDFTHWVACFGSPLSVNVIPRSEHREARIVNVSVGSYWM
jgi:hypothetical protein